MDDDLIYDPEEVMSNIDNAEVMSVFFPAFRKAVVIDTRSNDQEGPSVRIMPMVASPQERLRSIRRLRPGFPRLQNLTLIPWQRYVDSLVTMGVWAKIEDRIKESGDISAIEACDAALSELRHAERRELYAVIVGEGYQTIWSARQ